MKNSKNNNIIFGFSIQYFEYPNERILEYLKIKFGDFFDTEALLMSKKFCGIFSDLEN